MKNILCFGDSNTWGYEPLIARRYPADVRWTGVLQNSLGDGFRVIEEGLNGRTNITNEEGRPVRSGLDVLPILLESHRPLDLVVIMLGTNDLKHDFNLSAEQIADGARQVCRCVIDCEYLVDNPPQILLISPTQVELMTEEEQGLFIGAIEKSRELAGHYQAVAEDLGIHFLDASKIVVKTDRDGVHWDADQHKDFGKALSGMIRQII
ncbi:MAG: SGNH/GDSL hydrolase family protein [Candidatus Poseidoniales archaeon]|nr:SGNH/GDSL hydrolase family protein [Candidatus Poseidoniales archaeon]